MTELEWLKQQSGLTDDELKAMEAVAGHAKFVGMLQKIMISNETANKEKQDAEQMRLDYERRHETEVLPEIRKVIEGSLRAQGEAARMKAQLDLARQYSIVPPQDPAPAADPNAPPVRAPGSPDPNFATRDDFGRFTQNIAGDVIALNDINAEHFKLFGAPMGDSQALVDEMRRQRTLGNKAFSLKQAWEAKYEVSKKREEIKVAGQKKHDDEVRASAVKEERERNGANPNVRSGVPSRFSTYKPSDAGKEPWKAPQSKGHANRNWREAATAKVREAVAA